MSGFEEWELRRLDRWSVADEAEWRKRQAIESEWNTELQWLQTFRAADADPVKGRLYLRTPNPWGER